MCYDKPATLVLIFPLLVIQVVLVLANPTAQHDHVASILAKTNRTVPEYATRFAPLVWLHSEDPFRPSDIFEHIRHTTPSIDQKPIPDLPKLDMDNLALLNDVSDQEVALTSNDDITTMPHWLFGSTPDETGRISNATACAVILVERDARNVDVFYFYFYSFDRGANLTQVLDPLGSLVDDTDGMHYGNHVGDWEHNMIRFRDGNPVGIYYSQHSDGSAYDWGDGALSMTDGRPLVYSAYGSHANYESEGDHVHDYILVDYCDAGVLWDPVQSAYFYHMDATTSKLSRLFLPDTPLPLESNLTSFFYYLGIWGDAQYPNDHPSQITVPIFGLKRFVSGPQGPIYKGLVRKTLFPDVGEPKPVILFFIRILMAIYPCCLRGWRVWVSLGVFLVSVVTMVYGTRYLIRRYRTKGYQKLGTDIPLHDLESIETIVPRREEEVGAGG